MIRLYFQQALYHLRENPIITWVSVLGTALAICMIMVLVITFQVRLVDCEPEVNRSRSLYVSAMSVKNKGGSDGDSSNARMSVRTGRECFKNLTTAEAVTLVSLPEKVRVSLPAGNKVTADMVQTDDAFWHIFRFRFLSGKAFTKADSDAGVPCAVLSAAVARRLFGTTDVAGKTVQLNYVEYRISGVVTDVSVLATSAYAQVWVPYTSTDIARLTWWEETMGQMRAVILARSAADFPAIREERSNSAVSITTVCATRKCSIAGNPMNSLPTFTASGTKRPIPKPLSCAICSLSPSCCLCLPST